MKFYYEAHNKWGEPTKGEIDAGSEEEAAGKIREAGLFAREIGTEPIGRVKYEQGAVSAGPAQAKMYSPDRDDIDEASGTSHVDERGEPVRPDVKSLMKPDVKSLRMSEVTAPPAARPPEDDWVPADDRITEDQVIAEHQVITERILTDPPQAKLAMGCDGEPIKPRPLKKSYEDELSRQRAIEKKRSTVAAWQSTLAKDLEGISKVLGLMNQWHADCRGTSQGDPLPPGTPAVGGKTWEIYQAHRDSIASDMIKGVLARAAQRMPIDRLVS